MNAIGKLLPVDGYAVKLNATMPVNYTMALSHLYQPLIGIEATALYFTLAEDRHIQRNNTPQTHHTLMSYLNLPLDRIYRARLKLEAIGLLKTYKAKSEQMVYLYELQPPFSPSNFFNDAMLAQLLYHHIGEERFKRLKHQFITQPSFNVERDITASFQDVFQTFVPDGKAIVNEGDAEASAASPPLENVDFSWMRRMLKQRMIPVNQVLTPQNKTLIAQMMSVYGLTQLDLEKALLWALTEDNHIDASEFQTACHDLFKATYPNQPVQLAEKELSATEEREVTEPPATKEEQLVQRLETMSPKELLEDFSSGGRHPNKI
ncbi:Replication initiation and membrane attachment protein [Lentibacillus sp. JNUCC-1]|uniref:replication initiation and membrane attachment family protein n=1 Tax=Lentibacillus sp. JNUCC-1 TaxID=2654513 RepID=UPI0013294DF3|nr:hypothetical protein [Lentibacillus sp. JNUCC-1]MUV39355.1 Replication initiation and membrane attachment protein [Lentibacillus sp. JNUCC-1]